MPTPILLMCAVCAEQDEKQLCRVCTKSRQHSSRNIPTTEWLTRVPWLVDQALVANNSSASAFLTCSLLLLLLLLLLLRYRRVPGAATYRYHIPGILCVVHDVRILSVRFIRPYYKSEYREYVICLLYTSPSPRDGLLSRMPSSA